MPQRLSDESEISRIETQLEQAQREEDAELEQRKRHADEAEIKAAEKEAKD
jgi:hypothetical protein